MSKFNDDLMGLLTMNGGIQRGMHIRSKYDFSLFFANHHKNMKKEFCEKMYASAKKIGSTIGCAKL